MFDSFFKLTKETMVDLTIFQIEGTHTILIVILVLIVLGIISAILVWFNSY